MPTLTVEIPEHLARLVEDAVARGDYPDASAAVADALCILQYEPEAHGEKVAMLRREIRVGVIQADAGNVVETSFEEIAREVAAANDRAA